MKQLLSKIDLMKIDFTENERLLILKHDYNKVAKKLNDQADKLSEEEKKELHKDLMVMKMRIKFL